MPIDAGDPLRDSQSLDAAVDDALAGLPDPDPSDARGAVDYHWLGTGIRLALERPDEARHLLEMIGGRGADPVAPDEELVVAPGSGSVPVQSTLLARAAALPLGELPGDGPDAMFAWAGVLARSEIILMGRVVHEMLAAGASPDLGRGYGIAWDDGVRLPRKDLDRLFRAFTQLEMTVAGVLAGQDLRSEPAPRPEGGLSGLFGQLIPRARPGEAQAAAALDRSGEPGLLGLIAIWNAWMAVRYRTLIPPPTFELLVHPWTTVVGRLPEP